MSLADAYLAGMKKAAEKFAPPPAVQRSKVLGGKGQALDLSGMTPPTSPAQVAQTFNAHEQAATKQDVERKVAAAICTTCRKPKHYGPCKKPGSTAPEGRPMKAAADARKTLGDVTFRVDRPKGTVKSWNATTDKGHNTASWTYPTDYGYLPGHVGEDGEALDVFIGDDPNGYHGSFVKLKKDLKTPDETKFLVGLSPEEKKQVFDFFTPKWRIENKTYPTLADARDAMSRFKKAALGIQDMLHFERHLGPEGARELFNSLDKQWKGQSGQALRGSISFRPDGSKVITPYPRTSPPPIPADARRPKLSDFNAGLYGDRSDSGTEVNDEGPSMSPNYTAATSSDSGPARTRPGDPQAQARTTFSDFSRFRDPMIADEWSNAYGALVKTCANVNFGPYERRGPLSPAHEETVLRKGPPVAQGYVGDQTIDHAFGQIDGAVDSTSIDGGAGSPGGGPAVLG